MNIRKLKDQTWFEYCEEQVGLYADKAENAIEAYIFQNKDWKYLHPMIMNFVDTTDKDALGFFEFLDLDEGHLWALQHRLMPKQFRKQCFDQFMDYMESREPR